MKLTPVLAAVYRQLREFGLDLRLTFAAVSRVGRALGDYFLVRKLRKRSVDQHEFPIYPSYLIFRDKTESAGIARGHYFWQDLLVSREVFAQNPSRHVDVGSSIHGFVSHVASFREIEVVDVRPLPVAIPGVKFHQYSVTDSESHSIGQSDSVSCLHTLEHIGLGRYGDQLNFDGWKVGFDGLLRLVQPGGRLYLSVPTGKFQRVEFNAHRIFSLPFLFNFLASKVEIEELHFLDDFDRLNQVHEFGGEAFANSFNADFGLSIWYLRKYGGE